VLRARPGRAALGWLVCAGCGYAVGAARAWDGGGPARWAPAEAGNGTAAGPPRATAGPSLTDRSAEALAADVAAGRVTAEAVVRAHLARVAAVDRAGPALRSVLALNPAALAQARALDAEWRAGAVRGPLHGVPVVVKDNIETADPVATTAGSLALRDNVTGRDAPAVARLRAAGAVVLGKANLSEWSNFRSPDAVSGWSAVGGLTRNAYAPDRTACGSSAGSAVAVAAGLAAAALGTDTNGSITCPAAANGVVGLRPTLGLVSRRHVVPIASGQDAPGPIARSVRDAALVLAVIAGSDPADPATREADARRVDYAAALRPDALRGRRLGVMRFAMAHFEPGALAVFERALDTLRAAGAEVVDVRDFAVPDAMHRAAGAATLAEFRTELDAYLAGTPAAVRTRTLADVIAYNVSDPREGLARVGQQYLLYARASRGTGDPAYAPTRARARRLAGPEGNDALLARYRADALVGPTGNPAGPLGVPNSRRGPEASVGALAAVAGYPHLTVPMGFVGGLPVGLSFVGPAWSDARLLAFGDAFERRARARRPPRLAR
jgi:amidase